MRTLAAFAILLLAACAPTTDNRTAASDTVGTIATSEPAANATTPAYPAPAYPDPAYPAPANVAPQADTFRMPANPQSTASGLQYSIDRAGNGPQAQAGQTVTVHYTGWLTDGTKVDSSRDRNDPYDFPLGGGRVIAGWDEGVAMMRVGEKRTFIIPPSLGYGSRGMGGAIPPNATLVFTIELVGVR